VIEDNICENNGRGTKDANAINATNATNIDTGENFTLIQEAIDDSDTIDGHTIVVSPGVYNENLRVEKSLTIKPVNESYDGVTIISTNCRDATILITSDNVSIIGLSVQGLEESSGATTTRSDGIYLDGAQNCYIANCSISSSRMSVRTSSASNYTIEHNDIHGNYAGIFIANSADNAIRNNAIYGNNRGYGIRAWVTVNTTIAANNASYNGRSGIEAEKATDITIIGNNVSYNHCHGISMVNGTDITITANNASYNKKDGIYVEWSICEIRYNVVCWNRAWGIRAIDSDKSVIEDNLCENNGKE
jgi:parallel beta-helix repeat protein